jgi:hypothetical protein
MKQQNDNGSIDDSEKEVDSEGNTVNRSGVRNRRDENVGIF